MPDGILSDEGRLEPAYARFYHVGARLESGFPKAGKTGIGVDLEKHHVAPAKRDLMDVKPSYL